jgi:hypothetical protein
MKVGVSGWLLVVPLYRSTSADLHVAEASRNLKVDFVCRAQPSHIRWRQAVEKGGKDEPFG